METEEINKLIIAFIFIGIIIAIGITVLTGFVNTSSYSTTQTFTSSWAVSGTIRSVNGAFNVTITNSTGSVVDASNYIFTPALTSTSPAYLTIVNNVTNVGGCTLIK